jgi:hypothetical protein
MNLGLTIALGGRAFRAPTPTPSYIGVTAVTAGTGTSVSAAVPGDALAGDLILAFLQGNTSNTHTTPSGWTQVATVSGFTLLRLNSGWDGTTSSYAFSTGASIAEHNLILMAFRNASFGVSSVFSASGTNPTPASVTVPVEDSLNVTLVGAAGANTYTMPEGWTQRAITTGRSIAVFQRDALVGSGTLAGTTVTRATGATNSRALQFTLSPA